MNSKKVLFITQELFPYVPESPMSAVGRKLPQAVQDSGNEIRTFMPKWGIINERRNQLHEVIRLSGMNISIDDTDHPLIIKVASIQAARMQVYFIDNDEYFHKRKMLLDDKDKEYSDNAERAIFYARGVLETLKKLRWSPDIIHCQGWMSSIVPFYIKTAYKEEPPFVNSKVVFSFYNEMPQTPPPANFEACVEFHDANAEALAATGIDFTSPNAYGQLAIAFSDGVVQAENNAHEELLKYAQDKGLPTLQRGDSEDFVGLYNKFYDGILNLPE